MALRFITEKPGVCAFDVPLSVTVQFYDRPGSDEFGVSIVGQNTAPHLLSFGDQLDKAIYTLAAIRTRIASDPLAFEEWCDSPRGPACGETGGAPATPDGNHGDNDFGATK